MPNKPLSNLEFFNKRIRQSETIRDIQRHKEMLRVFESQKVALDFSSFPPLPRDIFSDGPNSTVSQHRTRCVFRLAEFQGERSGNSFQPIVCVCPRQR